MENLNNQDLEEQLEEIVFGIVSYAGEAKGYAYEALEMSENGKFDEAEELLEKSNGSFLKAHGVQTDLIQKEAAGEPTPINMLFVHAQDHIMTALSEKELITRMIAMNKRLHTLENMLNKSI